MKALGFSIGLLCLATPVAADTVESFVDTGCSTEVVVGLSEQIAAEVDCLMPGQLVIVPEGDGLVFAGAAVLPYLGEEARADLLAAAAEGEVRLNSGYRTVAQQYLIVRWFDAGRCGITAAADPGTSNHESGRAIDVGNWPDVIGALEAHGWDQTVPGDEVHFDHLASPDLRGSDVLAFQRLWNRNHPEDPIDEDGEFGPMTEARLAQSPAEGFSIGESCNTDLGHFWDNRPHKEPSSGEESPGDTVGGCQTGRGQPGLLVVLFIAAFWRRR